MRNIFFYIISVAFQLVGAEILLYKYFNFYKLTEYAEMRMKEENEFGDADVECKSEIKNDEKDYMNYIKELWINRMAFFYIGLGYLLSVFGKSTDDNCPCCIELMIIVFSCIFFGVTILTSNFMSKSKLEKWKQLKDKEIENKQ